MTHSHPTTAPQRRAPRTSKPRVESLEGRALTAVQIFEADGVLTLIGDRRANSVQIFDLDGVANPGEASIIRVLADGRFYETTSEIRDIRVDLGHGNDTLAYTLGDPGQFQTYFPDRQLTVSMGHGNDTVAARVDGFAFTGAPGVRALGPGAWYLAFDLGAGNDRLTFDLNADLLGIDHGGEDFTASILSVGAQGGAGNDAIQLNVLRDLRAELAQFDMVQRGGAGHDTLGMQSYGTIAAEEADIVLERYGDAGNDKLLGQIAVALAGNATFDQVLDGGHGHDTINTSSRTRSIRRA